MGRFEPNVAIGNPCAKPTHERMAWEMSEALVIRGGCVGHVGVGRLSFLRRLRVWNWQHKLAFRRHKGERCARAWLPVEHAEERDVAFLEDLEGGRTLIVFHISVMRILYTGWCFMFHIQVGVLSLRLT